MKFIFIKYPKLIQYLPRCLKGNKEWLRKIIDHNTEAFQYVSDDIKKDKKYILSFFEPYDYPFSELSTIETKHSSYQEEIQRGKRKRYLLLKYCDSSLKENMDNFSELLVAAEDEGYYEALTYIPLKFKDNLDFWLNVIQKNTSFIFFHKIIEQSDYLKSIKMGEYGLEQLEKDELINFLVSKIEKDRLEKTLSEQALASKKQRIKI